jgi:hypothetical protein
MGRALEGTPRRDFLPPDDVVFVKVDPDTGRPSNDIGSIDEAFIAGSEPTAANEPLNSIFIEDDGPGGVDPLRHRAPGSKR